MLEENTDNVRWKIYRYSSDIFFFTILGSCAWFVVGVLSLLNPKSNITVSPLIMFIAFFLACSFFLIIFLLERNALDKYPFHPPSLFSPLAYPLRSFEGGILILIVSCASILLSVGFFLSQNASLETEYMGAINITFWPVAAIKSFFSYRMFKKKYSF